ncbi:secretion ATPase [Sphaerotilus natans subsp. natans DSM 6575]|uniref:Secretion ATPase n=1 Tax=Sphaerotilus natans subsp. natans DSM 6575 TaxID=1286631 RepID=A0A059KG87_9BURK|nr:XrtA/PEP-CTERM system-associated ATPase [Sphaerotilus natans]KDB50461.1 secretion ATPase [Sphaerotilus natans subsp. natans DSM 6575]SIP95729.1 putative secretion ATPase, PEP-CTERM locus subfamily [Sphaerotilus natans]
MYESHFGFSGPPFQLNPDPAFYFNSRGHGRALAYLQYGVAQAEGFVVITGEIGAGKTTLVRMLLDGLDRQKVLPAQIVSTQLESGELLQSIITAFGIPSQASSSKAHLIATLEAFLTALAAQGRHALLIVDEAQNLDPRAVEELRMLSNFQLGNHALLQSFLVGQPELRRLLESPTMEQLRQRVTASCHLGPLTLEEARDYVEHRLRHVGWDGRRPAFADSAFDSLFRWSGGVPRRLNRLANRSLLAAFLDGVDTLDAALVERTAAELRSEIGEGDLAPVEPLAAPSTVAAPAPAPVPVAEPVAPPPPAPVLQFIAPPAPNPTPVPSPVLMPEPAPAPATIELDERARDSLEREPLPRMALPAARLQALTSAIRAARSHADGLLARRASRDVILCLADSTSAALKFAALAEAMAEIGRAPRMVLVSLGPLPLVWPWHGMGRVLPALEVGLDLEWVPGDIEQSLSRMVEGLGQFIEEFEPMAVLSLGSSDAMTACCLAAHQRGLPLLRLEAGIRATGPQAWNATMIEQASDVLFVPGEAAPMGQLRRQGLQPDRLFCVPDRLEADALARLWPEVPDPAGACLRNGLPMYFGPTWSVNGVEGESFMLVAVSLLGHSAEAVRRLVDALLGAGGPMRQLWLIDAPTREVLQALLAQDATLDGPVLLMPASGPRPAGLRERIDAARLLCCEIGSLPEQLGLLCGASATLVEESHGLADAAAQLGITLAEVDLSRGVLLGRVPDGPASESPLEAAALSALLQLDSRRAQPTGPVEPVSASGASVEIASHLQAWIDRLMSDRGGPLQPAA